MRTVLSIFVLLLLASFDSFAAPNAMPSWASDAASATLPSYDGAVPAAVLLNEQCVTIDPAGVLVTRVRKVIKILTHEGQANAEALIPYYRGGWRVSSLNAWVLAPDGAVRMYGKGSVVDFVAYDSMELYDDSRYVRLKADNPDVGSIFAYEAQLEERMLFAQDQYAFQDELPMLESCYVLSLAAGWRVQSAVFNHAPVEPVISGSTYTWRISQLPFRRREAYSPELSGMVPVLALSFFSDGDAGHPKQNCFRSWADVSRWHSALSAGQDDTSVELIQKVQELTASQKDEYSRIRAIARYVQSIKYVAIEMDEVHGGGYKPHAARLVFHKQYGDCKDKANLMRAMLKQAGIESYLVAIYSGDRTHVRPEWPSPTQFNHMIIAVRVSSETKAPILVNAASLGQHLLIFDPTSEVTPFGDLPWYEQGSFALLMAAGQGDLLQMPVLPPEANSTDLTITAELVGSGGLKAQCVLTDAGEYADEERAWKRCKTPADYQHHVEKIFSERIQGATVSAITADDSTASGQFGVRASVESPLYGQLMGGSLLVVSSSLVPPFSPTFPILHSRTTPIVLRAGLHRKHIRIKLPDHFTADEIPASAEEKTPWGSFFYSAQQKSGELLIEETIRIEAVTLPAEQYKQVKDFFDHISGADAQKTVLVRN